MKGTELSLSRETTLLLQDLALSTIQIHTLKVQAVQMHVQFYWICKFRNLAAHICRSRRCLAFVWLEMLTNIMHLVMLSASHLVAKLWLWYLLSPPVSRRRFILLFAYSTTEQLRISMGRLRQNVLTNQLREYCQCDPRLSESPALRIYFDL